MARHKHQSYDAVVIGSGIGGLTAGAYMANYGIKVLVCEQSLRPGGYFNSFKRKGYTFDGGIQGCEDSGLLRPMLRQLGLLGRIELCRSRLAFVTPDIFCPLEKLTDLELLFDQLKQVFPHESLGIERFKQESVEMCQVMEALTKAPNPMFQSVQQMALGMPIWIAKYSSQLKHLKAFSTLLSLPIEEYLATFIKDKNLIKFLAIGYRGSPAPFSMTFFYALSDYYYPAKGGMQALSNLLAQYIAEQGGEVRCKTLVENILIEKGQAVGVVLKGGETIRAPFIINNGDARRTFSEMVPPDIVPDEYQRRLQESVVGESVFSVYLGVDIPPEKLPTQGCPHLLLTPSYEPVAIEEIDTHPDFFRRALTMISLPSLFDPTLAPAGKSVIIMQCAATIQSMNHWGTKDGKRTEKYKACKKKIAGQLIDNAEQIIPGLSKKIELQLEATPFTFRDATLNTNGAAVGWTYHPREAFKGGIKGLFGSSNTPIKNLYQVGHWIMSPGGAPAGLMSGKIVSNTIRRRLRWGI